MPSTCYTTILHPSLTFFITSIFTLTFSIFHVSLKSKKKQNAVKHACSCPYFATQMVRFFLVRQQFTYHLCQLVKESQLWKLLMVLSQGWPENTAQETGLSLEQ